MDIQNVPMLTDRELLVSVVTDIEYIKKSIDDMDNEKTLSDNDCNKRISKLERWQSSVIGVSVGASALIAWGISFFRGTT